MLFYFKFIKFSYNSTSKLGVQSVIILMASSLVILIFSGHGLI
jgi:hypothetical protein